MKRSSRAKPEGASTLRNSITQEQTRLHPALEGLDESFKQSAAWSGPSIPLASDGLEMRMLRLPNTETDPCANTYLAALDGHLVDASSFEKSQEALVEHWSACLGHIRPSPVDWHKSSAVIWNHLGFEPPPGWTERMFCLARVDEATERACHAALFGVFASGDGNVQLEPVLNALATFIHAHPCFITMVQEANWHLPYGQNTHYRIGRQRPETVRKGRRKHRR
jgi:hypothetical protein